MPSWLHTAQLEVVPGAGLVGRWLGAVIVVGGDGAQGDSPAHLSSASFTSSTSSASSALDALIGSDGWPRPEVLRDRIEALDEPLDVAVVLEQSGADSVWVFSAGVPCFDAEGKQLSSGGATIEPGKSLRIGSREASVGQSAGQSADCHPALTLVEGVVPGGGAVLRAVAAGDAHSPSPVASAAVFDDGASYSLDTNYVIGREPAGQSKAGFSSIILGDDENSVSRAHAELEVRHGAIVLTDLGSTNGTHLLEVSTNQWSRLVPNVPTTLEPGSRVAIGSRQFVIEETP